GKFRVEHFDDDLASEASVAGDEDARHPTAAELALEVVRAGERSSQAVNQVSRVRFLTLAHDQLYGLKRFTEISSLAKRQQAASPRDPPHESNSDDRSRPRDPYSQTQSAHAGDSLEHPSAPAYRWCQR